MGGKAKVPAAPDYTPLAQASQKSADYAYQLAQRQQDWAEKTYNDNKAISDQVVSKAMAALDQQTADAARDRKRYETMFQPLEDQYVQQAKDYASPERQEQAAGAAEADVAAQFGAARQTAQQRLEAYGVDPSSTRAGALDLGTRVAEAAAQASAGNQARQQTEATGRGMIENAMNIGKGYPGQVGAEMTGAGQAGNQAASTGLATTASGAQTMGTGSSWQGMGNSAIGGWGQILGQGFSNSMDAYKAKQQASSGWGSALGLAGSIATSFLAEGGPVPEEPPPGPAIPPSPAGNQIPPSASPSGGQVTDDVPAQAGAIPMQLNAGEFVMPKDVTQWLGEKGLQDLILKARKQMQGGQGQRPAQPQQGPPQGGAIPLPTGG